MILSIPGSGYWYTGGAYKINWDHGYRYRYIDMGIWVRVQVLHVKSHGYGSETGSVGTGIQTSVSG